MERNKIYHGDTLATLKTFPDNVFDITVTSPPYNKNKAKGKLVKEVLYANAGDAKDESVYQQEQIDILNELYRVTKPNGHIFYNHKVRWMEGRMIHPMEWLMKSKWDMRQEIVWDRGIAGNLRGWRFWQVEERIYWMQKGLTRGDELESRHAKMTSIWKIRPENNSEHPAPFPIELPTRCIYSIAGDNSDFMVLDPYSGSGTTLKAAYLLSHNYVGIDNSEKYIAIAQERLKEVNEAHKVFAECKLHVVEKSYKERKKLKVSKS